MTCEAFPEQWEGELTTPTGRYFYFRYRGGLATLALGPTRRSVAGITRQEQTRKADVSVMRCGGNLDGFFRDDEQRGEVFRRLFGLIPQSEAHARTQLLGDGFPRPKPEQECQKAGPDQYTGRCHRDPGHSGEHRAYRVGWTEPFTW